MTSGLNIRMFCRMICKPTTNIANQAPHPLEMGRRMDNSMMAHDNG